MDWLRRSRMSLALRPWVAWTTCCPGPKDKSKGGSGLLRFAHGYKYPCHPGTYITCTQNGPCWYSTTNQQTPYNGGPALASYGGLNLMPRPMGGVFCGAWRPRGNHGDPGTAKPQPNFASFVSHALAARRGNPCHEACTKEKKLKRWRKSR